MRAGEFAAPPRCDPRGALSERGAAGLSSRRISFRQWNEHGRVLRIVGEVDPTDAANAVIVDIGLVQPRSDRRVSHVDTEQHVEFRVASADTAVHAFGWMGLLLGGAFDGDAEQHVPKIRKLAKDQREALGVLAASLRGRMESVMQAHGFTVGTLRGLVRDGLATADRGPAYFSPRAIVTMLEITEAGRKAIAE
jgi:hypothetical protein